MVKVIAVEVVIGNVKECAYDIYYMLYLSNAEIFLMCHLPYDAS